MSPAAYFYFSMVQTFNLKGSNFLTLIFISLMIRFKWSSRTMSVPFLHTYHRSRHCPPPVAPPSQTGPGNPAKWHSSPSDSMPGKLPLSHTYIVQINSSGLDGFFFVLPKFLNVLKSMKLAISNLLNIIWYGIAVKRTQTYEDSLCIFSDQRIFLEIFF